MSRIVDLRCARIGAACLRPVETAEDAEDGNDAIVGAAREAEIILFPNTRRFHQNRPRKFLNRRFARKAASTS